MNRRYLDNLAGSRRSIEKQREKDRKAHNSVIVLFKSYNTKNGDIHVQTSYKFSYILIELGQLPFQHIIDMSQSSLSKWVNVNMAIIDQYSTHPCNRRIQRKSVIKRASRQFKFLQGSQTNQISIRVGKFQKTGGQIGRGRRS